MSLNVRATYLLAHPRSNDPVLIWEGPLPRRGRFRPTNSIVLRMTDHQDDDKAERLYITVDKVVVYGVLSPYGRT